MDEWLENRPPLKDYLVAFIMVYGKKFRGFGDDGCLSIYLSTALLQKGRSTFSLVCSL